MSTTTVTHPDGTKTVITKTSHGCGCIGLFAVLLLVSACIQLPVLIPITVVVLAVVYAIKYKRGAA